MPNFGAAPRAGNDAPAVDLDPSPPDRDDPAPAPPPPVPPRSSPFDDVVLLTPHGGMLALEPGTGRVIQSPCRFEPDQAFVWSYGGGMLRPPPAAVAFPPMLWKCCPQENGRVAFDTGNGFLHAPPFPGAVATDAPEPDASAQFRPVPAADFRLLSRCAATRWLVGTDDRPTNHGALRLLDNFRLDFGGRTVALDDLLRAAGGAAGPRTPDGVPMSFTFFHDTCSASRALLYNPLIYSAISGTDHFFQQAGLCFETFEQFGGYDGCYRLVCDRDRAEVADCFRTIDDARWNSLRRDVGALDRLATARMDILTEPGFDGFQPILYVDSDVVCDRPIEPMLVEAARSERILIASEFGERSLAEVGLPHGNWFGLFLCEDDPRAARYRCINNGIFAARNRHVLIEPFAVVAEAWARFRTAHPGAHRAANDQPFYSCVLQSLDLVDVDSANRWICNLQGLEPDERYEPVGLAHFNIGVGMNKMAAMLRYIAVLEARRVPAQSAA